LEPMNYDTNHRLQYVSGSCRLDLQLS